jgi:hypothetical protein
VNEEANEYESDLKRELGSELMSEGANEWVIK